MTSGKQITGVKSYGVVFRKHGIPWDVLSVEDLPLPPLGSRSILVKSLGSPINPSDVGYIVGTYAIKPPFEQQERVVPGFEGAVEVLDVGSEVKGFSRSDWAIPNREVRDGGFGGTWRSHNVVTEETLLKIDSRDREFACTVLVNPQTAYHLIHDFVNLNPGDALIQSGANSSCGQLVIQIARAEGVKTINVVRDRPDFENLEKKLKALGATKVVRAEELDGFDFTKDPDTRVAPKLALDCVGGVSSLYLAKKLCPGGQLVSYGVMSNKAPMIRAEDLIFNGVSMKGFWLSNPSLKRDPKPLNLLLQMNKENKIRCPPCTYIHIKNSPNATDQLRKALKEAKSNKSDTKYLLSFD